MLFGEARKDLVFFQREDSEFGSLPKQTYFDIVTRWRTPQDAIDYAAKIGISKELLTNGKFLQKKSSASPINGGINKSLNGLYKAIIAVHGKPFANFQAWMGNPQRETFVDIVSSWKSPKEALNYASKIGITKEQLTNSNFLLTQARRPIVDGGIGLNLSGLYLAIKEHFQHSFKNFQRWMGVSEKLNVISNSIELVRSWKTNDDAINYAKSIGITIAQLTSSHFLLNLSKRPKSEGGIDKNLRLLYKAIKQEFQSFSNFKLWIGLKPSESFIARVRSWKTPEDAAKFAKSIGITIDQLTNVEFLQKIAKLKADQGGINRNLFPLHRALIKVFGTITNCKNWLKGTKHENFIEIVKSWAVPEDACEYAKQLGISKAQITNAKFLRIDAKKSKDKGGIERDLYRLYYAIKKVFQGSFIVFEEWMGKKRKTTFVEAVNNWKSPTDALQYATNLGLTKDEFLNAAFLNKKAKLSKKEGGIEKDLSGLLTAIRKRFSTFANFKKWVRVESATDFKNIVAIWATPEDAFNYGKSIGLTRDLLLNSRSLKNVVIGDARYSLQPLYRAIKGRFGSWQRFKIWMGGENTQSNTDFLKNLFNSKEGRHLESLAATLGEHALAEYLCVKYQDKFPHYNSSFVENLRRYLGEFEIPESNTPDQVPVGVLTITNLSHLKQALFNHYRDKYQSLFSKSLKVVEKKLRSVKSCANSPEQAEFVQSLIDYFKVVNSQQHPTRLKTQMKKEGEYPAKHQKIAVHEITDKKSLLLADEMGGGKTGSAIAGFEYLRDQKKAKKMLVICPAKVMAVWKTALSDEEDGYFEKGHAPKAAFIESEAKDWKKAKDAEYVIISMEMLKSFTNGIPDIELVKKLGADYFVIDEAHNAKKATGRNAERIFEISQTEKILKGYLVLLTGTPVPNTIKDVASQIRLLYASREQSDKVDFHHLPTLSRQIQNTKNPLLVRNFLVRRMLRRRTEDCLPVGCESTREILKAELTPIERAYYNSIVDNPFFSATEKIERLRRQCLESETKYDLIKTAISRSLKREKYKESENPAKIVIAESWFAKGVTRDIDNRRKEEALGRETYIASRLSNELNGSVKIFVLDGKNSKQRAEIIREFQLCKEPAILFTLVSVSGEGLNMSFASDCILITPTYTVAEEDQFLRRLLRKGQKQHVNFQIIECAGTIEEGILEYAARKNTIVRGLIDGRPLNQKEKEILNLNFTKVKEGGLIAYETYSPRQKALWILSRLYGKGKQAIEEFLASENGKYAKDFAEGYPQDEETSYSGNTSRVVAAVINSLHPKGGEIADIACGCRTLERMYEGIKRIKVSSSDINSAALEAGSKLLKRKSTVKDSEVSSMDELPYADASKDIAVISLALEFTAHSSRRKESGKERIKALSELNRILKEDGTTIITFQRKLFKNSAAFKRFSKTVEKDFGFQIVHEKTGLAHSADKDSKDNFNVWVLTLKKVSPAEPNLASARMWLDLRFPKSLKYSKGTQIRIQREERESSEKTGEYHDSFAIENHKLLFRAESPKQQTIKTEQQEVKKETARLEKRLKTLLSEYGSIATIPDHLLLSISLKEINAASQRERNMYFDLLLKHYRGVSKVPIEMIQRECDAILVKGECKKGEYLCFTGINTGKKKHRYSGRTRYFYKEDIQ